MNIFMKREGEVILPSDLNTRCKCNPIPDVGITYEELMESLSRSMFHSSFNMTPSRIVKSGSCTIVFWKDGTKTVVRCPADTVPNDYEAFTAALAIKIFGTNSQVKKLIQRLTVIQPPKEKKKKAESAEDKPAQDESPAPDSAKSDFQNGLETFVDLMFNQPLPSQEDIDRLYGYSDGETK